MKKTFKWLNISQFTGAFNDNAFKMVAAIMPVKILGQGSLPTVLAICSALFVVPFLLSYLRKASAEDFQTLETVITGGEKLHSQLADSFKEKFSVRPMEGYGCTELSPVALLNNGLPLPGIAIRIVDPETRVTCPDGEEGLMLVKGPNVMQGYLGQPEKTAEVLCDGWYNTGDIARMDTLGVVTLTGRLSRFSKIAGEMVPHGAVEEALQQAAESAEPCVAVVSIADETKGEQLAVCYTAEAGDAASLVSKLRKLDIPNLWIPRAANFFRIQKLPILGTGKLDLCAIQTLVNQ